jgi:hypothetical protein
MLCQMLHRLALIIHIPKNLATLLAGETIKCFKMKFYLFLITAFFFSCSGSRIYHYDRRHYLHLKLVVMKKNNEFKIINSRKELQPFGFSINGNWSRLSDSMLLLIADSNTYSSHILPDSSIVKINDEFNWELYKKYGNNYIFPFFKTDTLYELNNKQSVRFRQIVFKRK